MVGLHRVAAFAQNIEHAIDRLLASQRLLARILTLERLSLGAALQGCMGGNVRINIQDSDLLK